MAREAEIWFRRSQERFIQWPRPIHWKGWLLVVVAPIAAIAAGIASIPYVGNQRWLILVAIAVLGIWVRWIIDRHTKHV